MRGVPNATQTLSLMRMCLDIAPESDIRIQVTEILCGLSRLWELNIAGSILYIGRGE